MKNELREKISKKLLKPYFYSSEVVELDKTIDQILELAKKEAIECMPEKELHTHDSIPCYTGEENNGCFICFRNEIIEQTLKNIEERFK